MTKNIKSKMKIEKNEIRKICIDVLFIVVASICGAVGARVFTTNAQFAPAGLEGVCFMLAKTVGLDVDLWGLIINIPLIVVGYIFLKKKYVIYTLLYTLLSNVLIRIFIATNMPIMTMNLDDIGTRLLCCLFAGILFGVRAGFVLRVGGSTGGLDIPSCLIVKKWRGLNIEVVINGLCLVLIGVSYFVYENFVSVLLSIIQIIITALVTRFAIRGARNAIECKIVTKEPDMVKDIVINKMRHSATVIDSRGGFSDKENTTIMAVITIRELSTFINEIQKVPHTFTYYSEVSGLVGNFRWRKEDVTK